MLHVRTRLPEIEWVVSNIALEVGFSNNLGLDLILYYLSKRDFMNSLTISSDP